MIKKITIEDFEISEEKPCMIIGEIGSNHNSNKKTVKKLIDACSDAKFDAVKFQIYDAEEAFSKNEMTSDVKLDHLYGLKPWWEVARDKILMPRDWFSEMFDYARSKNLIPLSAIHRKEDADFLIQFGLSAFKIASIDLYYRQLLNDLVQYNLPMIVSTGMSHMHEISETMEFFEKNNLHEVILLHCISCYPPEPNQMNMNNILSFKQSFDTLVGFSDHSTGITSAIIAVTLGAKVIEKHITLDKKYPGADHPFAIEPEEMKLMANAIRETESSLGSHKRILTQQELDARKMIRRSVVTKVDLIKGDKITRDKIKFARPGTGIPTNEFKYIENRRINQNLRSETTLKWEMINE